MRCTNQGGGYGGAEFDAQWSCVADLPPELRLAAADVVCEGYSGPDDPYVLRGSCGVVYTLALTERGEARFPELVGGGGGGGWWGTDGTRRDGSESVDWSAILFSDVFLAVCAWILVSACRNAAANNNNTGDDDDGINGNHDGDGTASKRNFTRYTWTEAEMAQAERAVQGGESVRAAARRFGVPPSSLNSRTRGREPRDLKGDVSRLTLKQESLLAEWASAQARLGFPPAKDDVFDLAERVLRRSAPDGRTKLGKQWIGHWLRRWPHVEVLDWKAKQAGETRRRGLDLFDDSHSAVIQSEGQQQQQQQQQQPQQLEQQSTAEG